MKLMSSPNCYHIFSIALLETLKFEWQYGQYLELNRACGCAHFHFQSKKDMVKKITIFSHSFREGTEMDVIFMDFPKEN